MYYRLIYWWIGEDIGQVSKNDWWIGGDIGQISTNDWWIGEDTTLGQTLHYYLILFYNIFCDHHMTDQIRMIGG